MLDPAVARHLFRGSSTCDNPGRSGATGATGPFRGGCSAILLLHLKKPRILRKSAAKRVARQGVPAHVCNYDLRSEQTDKEKSHKGIWWWECPGSVPGINSGHPTDTRDVWADLCGNSHSRGRMSAGQTGQMMGQMGHVHGTDRTLTRGCPAKILYV